MKVNKNIKNLPNSPGVYIFLNKKGTVLYVGRAINLKRRVSQYFSGRIDLRIKEMVENAFKVKVEKTETILEAIILEANLIKQYWPKYNVKDRDDRSFIYIVIPKNDYPYPQIIRKGEVRQSLKNAKIFGPYQSLSLLQNALKVIRRIFPYSPCKPSAGKPCFNAQIGLCPGQCIGKISKGDYQKNIDNIILLLSGEKKRLLRVLERENPEKKLALKHIREVSLLAKDSELKSEKIPYRIEGYDISHLTGKETYGSMVVFIDGKPKNGDYRLFKIKTAPVSDDLRSLGEMIERRFKYPEWKTPDLILIDGGTPQINFISKTLDKINIAIPIVGISKYKNDQLVFLAKTKKSAKFLISSLKDILLEVRDEAHRFALKASKSKRKIAKNVYFQQKMGKFE